MTVSHVNTQIGSPNGSGGTTSTSTVPKPVGLAVGDVMLAFVNANQAGITQPTGFTQIGSNHDSTAGNLYRSAAYYKVAVAGDVAATNFVFTNGDSSSPIFGVISAYRGVSNSSPINANGFTITSTASPKSTPGITTTFNAMIVHALTIRLASGTNTFSSSVTNERFDSGNRSTVGYWMAGYDSGSESSPGSISGVSISMTGTPTDGVAYTIALTTAGTSAPADEATGASVTAYAATVQTINVGFGDVAGSALDPSISLAAPAGLGSAVGQAYDATRPMLPPSVSATVAAYDASTHLDVNADRADVLVDTKKPVAYYGAPVVRMTVVEPENRTYMVRR